ncbi:DNA cytosine methyltransferase [Aeromonas hydrophila]
MREIIIDNFAGGGGASTGIENATGRGPDEAINHDPEAVAMHEANHPFTRHHCENIWDVEPRDIAQGRPVALVWLSPDCRHFSKAKGGAPVSKRVRGLAWIALRYALQVKPRYFMLENVEEFQTWGPLAEDGQPCKSRKGDTFRAFVQMLGKGIPPAERHGHPAVSEVRAVLGLDKVDLARLVRGMGYRVEWRELTACHYGAPTSRKRFFLIASRDDGQVTWPVATHGEPGSEAVRKGFLKPWPVFADCIDWSIPCPSIFWTKEEARAHGFPRIKRPLADKTLARIAKGLKKFVIDNPNPFIAPNCVAPFITEMANGSSQRNMAADEPMRTHCAQVKGGHFAMVAPVLVRHFGKSTAADIDSPAPTIMGGADKNVLVAAWLSKYYGGVVGVGADQPAPTITTIDHNALVTSYLVKMRGQCHSQDLREPMPVVTAGGKHLAEVRAFLIKYYGTAVGAPLDEPMHTATTNDRFGLVTIHGDQYQIVDIGLRMFKRHELFAGNGFPPDYIIDHDVHGNPITEESAIARCGNAVPPQFAEALVRANLPDLCIDKIEKAA